MGSGSAARPPGGSRRTGCSTGCRVAWEWIAAVRAAYHSPRQRSRAVPTGVRVRVFPLFPSVPLAIWSGGTCSDLQTLLLVPLFPLNKKRDPYTRIHARARRTLTRMPLRGEQGNNSTCMAFDLRVSAEICSPHRGNKRGNREGNRHNRAPSHRLGALWGAGYSSSSAADPTGNPAEVNSMSHAAAGPILTRCRGRTLPDFSLLVDT